jgi:hypothetical protein
MAKGNALQRTLPVWLGTPQLDWFTRWMIETPKLFTAARIVAK